MDDTDPTGNPKVDLGKILEKVQDLKLGELLEEPSPGTDEAIAVAPAKITLLAEATARAVRPTC